MPPDTNRGPAVGGGWARLGGRKAVQPSCRDEVVAASASLVQSRGEPAVELRPGDVVYTPDGEGHWHGATPEHFMTHLSTTEGTPHWGDHVGDEDYQPSR